MLTKDIKVGFINHCIGKRLSPHSVRAYDQDLSDFQRWLKTYDFHDLWTRETLINWKYNLIKRNLAPTSIRRKLACLKVFCKWMEECGYMINNPFHRFSTQIRIPHRLPRNLTINEIQILREVINNQSYTTLKTQCSIEAFKIIIELLLTTGIRVGELCAIQIGDIDFFSRTITIHGKGNRERLVFIVDIEIERVLKQYIQFRNRITTESGYLLTTSRGTQITPDYVRHIVHKLAEKAGIHRNITPHMFRHTAATQLLEAGVDICYVQKLLGHSSISTTEIYIHISNNSLRKAISGAKIRSRTSNL